MNHTLNKTSKQLTSITRGGTTYGKAYNKPILLLTLIDLIEDHNIKDNRIVIDDELFKLFKRNWHWVDDKLHVHVKFLTRCL